MIRTSRLRLIIAAVLFVGWMSWLGYASLSKSRAPVVSRARAASASHAIEARLTPGSDGMSQSTATVVRSVKGGLHPGSEIEVANLPDAVGFEGEGNYLLLLSKGTSSKEFRVVGQQRSPGYEISAKPEIYRWSPDVELQATILFPEGD